MAKPTRTSPLTDTDIENLNRHCLFITFTPDNVEDIGLDCGIVKDLYASVHLDDKLEGILKLPQQDEIDEFLAVFTPGDVLLSAERLKTPVGRRDLTFPDGSSARYKGTSKQLAEIKATEKELYKVLLQNLESCLVRGTPKDVSMVWFPNPMFVKTSTPYKPDKAEGLVQKLVAQVADAPTETLQQLLTALCVEAEKRGAPIPSLPVPSGPKPDSPKPSKDVTVLDPNVLGETIAKANESLIETLAHHGLLRSQTPKISQFSGDSLKGDVSFEQWEYEVEILKATHTESAIREAITKSLKGSAAEALRALGPLATLEQILVSFRGKYGIAASYDTLMSDLYTFTQQDEETVPQFATKIETKLSSIKWKFPGNVTVDVESRILRDRLFFGIKKDIRDSIRYRFSDPSVTYSDLLRYARESEVENQTLKSSCDSNKEKKEKSKVKSSSVTTSTSGQNTPSPTSNPDLEKLTKAAEKVQKETEKAEALLKELLDSINQFNNPSTNNRGRGNGFRGRGNGFRGRGRGRGNGNGYGRGNAQGNQGQTQNQSSSNQQGQRRTPKCFHCIQNGADKVDHWPNQCEWLKSILQDWHSTQSVLGHQNQSQNLNT